MNNSNKRICIAYDMGYRSNKRGLILGLKENIKSPIKRSSGYCAFTIRIGKKKHNIPIHRFVAYCKYGHYIFNEGLVVRHLDGNKTNNTYGNIRIGTQSENSMDRDPINRIKHAIVASSYIKKYNHNDVYSAHLRGVSYKGIMEEFNISSKGTVSYIINAMKNLKNTL